MMVNVHDSWRSLEGLIKDIDDMASDAKADLESNIFRGEHFNCF